ncbi:MAG: MFS family permease [Planctomycetota bacterium]
MPDCWLRWSKKQIACWDDHMSDIEETGASWSELLTLQYLPKLATLAIALWLHAANSMLTATTMPSAIEEIGGLHLISWTFALYLAGSIAAASSISMVVARLGVRKSMIRSAIVFTIGCVIVATAPSMPVLLIGRVLQGLGGGALIALVYISQARFFPNRFLPRTIGFLSMVWMLSAFTGPSIGGAFATIGEWRLAYWIFAVQGLLLIPAVHLLLKGGDSSGPIVEQSIPVVRILLLTMAILLFSLSAASYDPLWSPMLVLLGCATLFLFVLRDKQATESPILPKQATDLHHSIGNGILATFLLCLCIMSFLVYGPFILINLYGLSPFQAGLVVMVETIAWGSAAIMFSGLDSKFEPRLIRCGSVMVVTGIIAIAFTLPAGNITALVVAVVVCNAGFGMMWGFIIKRIVGAASALDKDRSASMMPITQQTGFALGAALSGLIANGLGLSADASHTELQRVAFWLFAGFVPVAVLGGIMAWRFVAFKQPIQAAATAESGVPT